MPEDSYTRMEGMLLDLKFMARQPRGNAFSQVMKK
jgi:hypothetical protein